MSKHATHYEACPTSFLRQFQLDMAHSMPTLFQTPHQLIFFNVTLSHIVTCVEHQLHMQFCFLSFGHHEHVF